MATQNQKRAGKEMLVVKDNALINASYKLELVEHRLILLAIIEARESGKGINANDPLTIHASSYMNQFHVERQTAYKNLKDACKALFSRQFTYDEINENGNITTYTSRWISKIGYTNAEAVVKLIFSPDVVPLITRLERHFTSYDIDQCAKLSSKYSARLYEILIAWRSTGKSPTFEIKAFRKMLGLEDSEYSAMSDFKKYVLDMSVKQINLNSDITVSYEQQKTGRTISAFTFRFKQKAKAKALKHDTDQNDCFIKLSDAQRQLFGSKLALDPRVQSIYAQRLPSHNYDVFGAALAELLLEEKHFKTFLPILIDHGFQPPKK